MENYKHLKRHSVFSHEELLCRMASSAEDIDPEIAVKTAEELGAVLELEKSRRELVKQKVVILSENYSCFGLFTSFCLLFWLVLDLHGWLVVDVVCLYLYMCLCFCLSLCWLGVILVNSLTCQSLDITD